MKKTMGELKRIKKILNEVHEENGGDTATKVFMRMSPKDKVITTAYFGSLFLLLVLAIKAVFCFFSDDEVVNAKYIDGGSKQEQCFVNSEKTVFVDCSQINNKIKDLDFKKSLENNKYKEVKS